MAMMDGADSSRPTTSTLRNHNYAPLIGIGWNQIDRGLALFLQGELKRACGFRGTDFGRVQASLGIIFASLQTAGMGANHPRTSVVDRRMEEMKELRRC